MLPKIPRPTHANFADLNGDGRNDLIVSMYGNNIGRLSWFEKKENGDYAENILLPRSGTLSTAVHDFNGDGQPDFVVTNGDNGEYPSPPKSYHGIRVYLNRGGMNYEKSLFLPLNGAFRALARDYDADGDTDIPAVS